MNPTTPEEIVADIAKRLESWDRQAMVLLIIYILMGVAAVVASVGIGFFGPSIRPWITRLLGFASALCIALIGAFSIGEVSGRLRDACRRMHTAIYTYRATAPDTNSPFPDQSRLKVLINEYSVCESIIGNVTFKSPDPQQPPKTASTLTMQLDQIAKAAAENVPKAPKDQTVEFIPQNGEKVVGTFPKASGKKYFVLVTPKGVLRTQDGASLSPWGTQEKAPDGSPFPGKPYGALVVKNTEGQQFVLSDPDKPFIVETTGPLTIGLNQPADVGQTTMGKYSVDLKLITEKQTNSATP